MDTVVLCLVECYGKDLLAAAHESWQWNEYPDTFSYAQTCGSR